MSEILTEPLSVEACFVHSYETDRREVVVECSEIVLCVRIETFIKKLGDGVSLDLERSCTDVHEMVESLVEIINIVGKICDTGNVDGNNAYGTCGFA